MAAIFFGVIVLMPTAPFDAGFCAPSATQPAVALLVTTGTSAPLMPSGTWRASCMNEDDLRAWSKYAAAWSGLRKPAKSLVLLAAVIAMRTPRRGGASLDAECVLERRLDAVAIQRERGRLALTQNRDMLCRSGRIALRLDELLDLLRLRR